MARLTSRLNTRFKGKAIKFLEDGSIPSDAEIVSIDSRESTREPEEIKNNEKGEDVEGEDDSEDADEAENDLKDGQEKKNSDQESDSDSDSDSDAPEEESTASSKQASIEKLKQEKQRQQELRKLEREKRKQRDAQLKLQLEARRERIRELASAEELPEFLPEEVLEPEEPKSLGKHIRLEELEKEHAESRKRAKLEKLRQIKDLRRKALDKGPVQVQVQTFGQSKRSVPRAEASVLESKNSWLQRASLGKK